MTFPMSFAVCVLVLHLASVLSSTFVRDETSVVTFRRVVRQAKRKTNATRIIVRRSVPKDVSNEVSNEVVASSRVDGDWTTNKAAEPEFGLSEHQAVETNREKRPDLKLRWAPVDTKWCNPQMPFNVNARAQGFYSKRLGIMFWKGAFRREKSMALYDECSDGAVPIQSAISRSHVRHLIEPLEAAGYVVDILIHSSSCEGAVGKTRASKLQESLVGFYNTGRQRVVNQTSRNGVDQAESNSMGLTFLLDFIRGSDVRHESFLLWRLDVVPMGPLSVSKSESNGLEEPLIRDLPWKSFDGASYPDVARQGYVVALQDNIMVVAGWAASCLLYKVAQGVTTNRWGFKRADWWLGVADNNDPKAFSNRYFGQTSHTAIFGGMHVYRGPLTYSFYSGGPMKICKFLETSFGGPSCKLNDLALQKCTETCEQERKSVATKGSSAQCFRTFWKKLDAMQESLEKQRSVGPRMAAGVARAGFPDAQADDASSPRRHECKAH